MREWWHRLDAAPLWVLFLFSAAFFGVATLVLPGPNYASVPRAVRGGLIFGIFMTTFYRVMRRRDRAAAGTGDFDRVSVARALRTGTPPSDPAFDPALVGLVKRRRSQLSWSTKVSPVLFGSLALMSIGLAFTKAIWFIYAALFVVMIPVMAAATRRANRRLDQLESALHQR